MIRRRWSSVSVQIVLAAACTITALACGSSSPSTPAAPSKPSSRFAINGFTATTQRQGDGALWYLLQFTLGESGGVGGTLGTVNVTITRSTGPSSISGAATDVFSSARVAANTSVLGATQITSTSTAQATSISIQIAYTDDNGTAGTVAGTASVTPAPDVPPPSTCTAPGTATNLTVAVSGSTATFAWSAPTSGGTVVNYALNIGTSPGASDIDSRTVTTNSYTFNGLSNRTYYARVLARNTCASGAASNEVVFTIGSGGGSTPPSSWTGSLPGTSGGSTHPVCSQALPNPAACINDLFGPAEALCQDRAFSCSTGSGTCAAHGGVYCWRN